MERRTKMATWDLLLLAGMSLSLADSIGSSNEKPHRLRKRGDYDDDDDFWGLYWGNNLCQNFHPRCVRWALNGWCDVAKSWTKYYCCWSCNSATTGCPVGKTRNGDKQCQAINYCGTAPKHQPCHGNSMCVNAVGGYYCVCETGTRWDRALGRCVESIITTTKVTTTHEATTTLQATTTPLATTTSEATTPEVTTTPEPITTPVATTTSKVTKATTTTTTTALPDTCEDTDTQLCISKKNQGFCTMLPEMMRDNCLKTCGWCSQ